MFEKFYKFYKISNVGDLTLLKENLLSGFMENTVGFKEFMCNFQGTIFGRGEYRLHNIRDIGKWNDIVSDAFPEVKGKIECFGSDWLGRQFAIYNGIEENEKILMFEPGTGYILEIPCNFVDFHNDMLINNYDSCVAINFYQMWLQKNNNILSYNQCVGYKIPLFLGGEDNTDNLELTDMEVYWDISAQLIAKIK